MPAITARARVAFLLLSAALVGAAQPQPAQLPPARLLLRGDVVTPEGFMRGAWLDILDGHILRIERERPNLPGVPILETDDLIFPGFIDLHNHPIFNVFPRWTPPRKFPNRYAWRDADIYRAALEDPEKALTASGANFCDIDEYVEVKALLGGTTSMIGFTGRGSSKILPTCIQGLVRNLDVFTGFYGTTQGHERIVNSIGVLPRDMDTNAAAEVAQGIANGRIDLLTIHIAEGLPTDAESAQELDMLEARGLLTPHTALVHSVGLSPSQLARVHRAGASIVWSPRSNFELYGATANVAAAFREGVTLSIAPDWSPSGSDNLFDEIKYADRVNREQFHRLFSSRQLVEMASAIPARVAHIDDKVGTLAPGMLADLFLVHPTHHDPERSPYESITSGSFGDIDLVMISGVPLYGDSAMLHALRVQTEALDVCGVSRALNADALPSGSFSAVESRLKKEMKKVGAELAPLAECGR